MKNKLLILFIIISVICFGGCSNAREIFDKSKPSLNYYTENLNKTISAEKPKDIKVFYKEFFEEFTFPTPEKADIMNFINILNEENFVEKPEDLPDSYKYKVYLDFTDCKYALTIFNEKYISIYNWDGKYEVDYIDMSDIPLQLNLYGICKFFTKD